MSDALLWEELPLDFTNPADKYRVKGYLTGHRTNNKRITTRFSTKPTHIVLHALPHMHKVEFIEMKRYIWSTAEEPNRKDDGYAAAHADPWKLNSDTSPPLASRHQKGKRTH